MLKKLDWKKALYSQRKWDLDKAKELLQTSNVILIRGAKGIGKSFFIDRIVEELSFKSKQIILRVQCQEGEVNDIHQMGMNLSGEVQALNVNSKTKERKKSRVLNFSIAIGGALLGPFSMGIGFLFTFLGFAIEFKGVYDDRKQKKRYSSNKGYTLSALEDELKHAIEKGNLKNITIALKCGEYLDAAEQESLAVLITTFKHTNVVYHILLEAPSNIEFDALISNKNVEHHFFDLLPIEDIGGLLQLVFPSISNNQISKLQEASAGSPKVVNDTIEGIIDDEAFFDSTVNTSDILDNEFDIEIQHHVLQGNYAFQNLAVIERNFNQLKKHQQDFLISLSGTAKEYYLELLNNIEYKFHQRFVALEESKKWFDIFESTVRFKSVTIQEFLQEQTPKAGLKEAFQANLIQQIETMLIHKNEGDHEVNFKLAKQLLLLETGSSILLLRVMLLLIQTRNTYYVTQLATPLYEYITKHADFTDPEIDNKFSHVFISTMDSVSDDLMKKLLNKLPELDCLTSNLITIYHLYTMGSIDKAIEKNVALIKREQSAQIQLWLHNILFSFLNKKMDGLKVSIKRAKIVGSNKSKVQIQELYEQLTFTTKRLSELNASLLAISDKSPEVLRKALWLSVLIERKVNTAGGHIAIAEKMQSRLTQLTDKETTLCELIDINDYALANTALFIKKRDVEAKRKANETKKHLLKRMNAVNINLVALFRQGELDREQWITAIDYFYWLTHYDPNWFKKDIMIDSQNALREVLSYRDVNKLYNSVHNYEALVRLSRVEVAFYVEHSKGILVDRAIKILRNLLSVSVFQYENNKLIDFSKLSQLISHIDDNLDIGEYPKLKASFLEFFVQESLQKAENDTFANNALMKLCSKTARYFEYLQDFKQAELFYQKEYQCLRIAKSSNLENVIYTEIITLLNMTATSLKLGRSTTRRKTINKRLELIEDKLSNYSGCQNLVDYAQSTNFREYKFRPTLSVITRMADINVTLGNAEKALYFCGIAERINKRFGKKHLSKAIIKHKINAYILKKEFEIAFFYVNEQIDVQGANFIGEHIETIITLLAQSNYQNIEKSIRVVSSLKFVLQKSSGVNSNEIILLKPLYDLLEASKSHYGLFPFHPNLVQPWNARQKNIRLSLANLRRSLKGTGEKAAWILELLYLLASALPEHAEWFRQLGLALITDSRFPTEAKLDKYKNFEQKVWGDDWLLNTLLLSTRENWGRFTHVHTKQRKGVIKEIYDALTHIYSLTPNEKNKSVLLDILKREGEDHYMVFKRLIRHSNNRSNQFTHEEMDAMFGELKKLRITLRRQYKEKFGEYSYKDKKKPLTANNSSTKKAA